MSESKSSTWWPSYLMSFVSLLIAGSACWISWANHEELKESRQPHIGMVSFTRDHQVNGLFPFGPEGEIRNYGTGTANEIKIHCEAHIEHSDQKIQINASIESDHLMPGESTTFSISDLNSFDFLEITGFEHDVDAVSKNPGSQLGKLAITVSWNNLKGESKSIDRTFNVVSSKQQEEHLLRLSFLPTN